MVVVEGATVRPWSETHHACCRYLSKHRRPRLLLLAAVHTSHLRTPTFAGLTVGLEAFHSGAGVIGALLVGLLAGGATLALGQVAVASTRTPLIHFILGLVYGLPAAIAGYHVSFALAGIGMPSSVWRTAFAVIGAIASGCTAFSRLAHFVPPAGRHRAGVAYSPHDGRLHDQGH